MKMVKLLLLLPIALLMLTSVHATTPTLVTGIFFANGPGTVTEVRTANDNLFGNATVPFTFTVRIQGVGVVSVSATLHNSTGQLAAGGRIAFTGTAMGSQPGSAVILFEGMGTAAVGGSSGSFQANLVLSDGTDGLANIRGEGTLQVQSGHGTYSALVHFDPA